MADIEELFDDWTEEFVANLLLAAMAVVFKDTPFYYISLGTFFLLISALITILSTYQAYAKGENERLINILIALIAASLVFS